jgi:hypothetical protein
MPEMKSLEEWKAAVRRSYLASVTEEEYDAKAIDDSIARVAQFFRETGYDFEDVDNEALPQLLMDFLAFTGNTGVPSTQGYLSEIDLPQGVSLKVRANGGEVVLVFDRSEEVSIRELTPVVNDQTIDPFVAVTLNVVPGRRESCIHPNVFATGPVDGSTEHCYTCDTDVPRSQL